MNRFLAITELVRGIDVDEKKLAEGDRYAVFGVTRDFVLYCAKTNEKIRAALEVLKENSDFEVWKDDIWEDLEEKNKNFLEREKAFFVEEDASETDEYLIRCPAVWDLIKNLLALRKAGGGVFPEEIQAFLDALFTIREQVRTEALRMIEIDAYYKGGIYETWWEERELGDRAVVLKTEEAAVQGSLVVVSDVEGQQEAWEGLETMLGKTREEARAQPPSHSAR